MMMVTSECWGYAIATSQLVAWRYVLKESGWQCVMKAGTEMML
jgi:hypothetical protein